MKLTRVTIKNFKAIEDTSLDFGEFTVIVGANGSGKSSVLQALHWMFQSGRNRTIETNKNPEKGSTLSEKDATYMPSPEYRNAGHGPEYGNKGGTPQLDISVEATDGDGAILEASMWIKSARNEGLSVHVPSNNDFVVKLRDQSKEFSSYIPGLAGIPLSEEKRTKLIVHRQAAAGDANTVLRNVLLLLKDISLDGKSGLNAVQAFVSEVMSNLTLNVEFNEDRHSSIIAEFNTQEMQDADPKRMKPLELAGIGFLQVIQIFAYLVYFRPVVLLVDEPDSHLHPATQERLVQVLARAAREYGTQVILTTHSPSVVRALPADARVVWMKGGKVQGDGDTSGRQMMGWGLLDKRILLLTEDSKTYLLRALLSQWPDLERVVALWPLHGSGKLLDVKGCESLQSLFGNGMKIVLHRDRDFMMPEEAKAFSKPYSDHGISVWLTKHSDVEAYWAEKEVLKAYFFFDDQQAENLLDNAVKAAKQNEGDKKVRNKKRNDIRNKLTECQKGDIGAFNDDEVVAYYSDNGLHQHVILGKTLCEKIRAQAQADGTHSSSSFGKSVPSGVYGKVAQDLKSLLDQHLA